MSAKPNKLLLTLTYKRVHRHSLKSVRIPFPTHFCRHIPYLSVMFVCIFPDIFSTSPDTLSVRKCHFVCSVPYCRKSPYRSCKPFFLPRPPHSFTRVRVDTAGHFSGRERRCGCKSRGFPGAIEGQWRTIVLDNHSSPHLLSFLMQYGFIPTLAISEKEMG